MVHPHDLPPSAAAEPAPSPAQWAVRWHGVVLVGLLIVIVPLLHLGWHVVLGQERPLVQTRSQTPAAEPTATMATVRDGTWMQKQELYLREASPVVWWLRSNWNELLYRVGLPQSSQVHFGRDEWFFITPSVTPDIRRFERAAPQRRQFLHEVHERVRAAGAEFFMVVVPDKARVYADKAYADGVISAAKAPVYATLLGELGADGIPTLDLAAVMAAARAAAPDEDLYYRRDTHWRPAGALVAGRAVAAAIEQRFGALLSPRQSIELGGLTSVRAVGDLVALFGIGTVDLPDARGEKRTVAMSLLSEHFAEARDYYGITLRDGNRSLPMRSDDPNAEVLLIGTSFSEENGQNALSLALGRPVRGLIVRGAAGMEPLRLAMAELAKGTRAKVVIWEMVERGFFDEAWRDPHF